MFPQLRLQRFGLLKLPRPKSQRRDAHLPLQLCRIHRQCRLQLLRRYRLQLRKWIIAHYPQQVWVVARGGRDLGSQSRRFALDFYRSLSSLPFSQLHPGSRYIDIFIHISFIRLTL